MELENSSTNPMRLAEITACILAGGLGTRLRSTIGEHPKVIAQVAGRLFVTFLLDKLLAVGIRKVVLCTGYQADEFRQTLGDEYLGLPLVYSQETEPLGTGGALRLACPFFDSSTVLVLNGDSFCTSDLKSFYDWHSERSTAGSLLLIHQQDTRACGRVEVDEQGVIRSFLEKSNCQESGWINAGVYLLSKSLIETIPQGQSISLEKDVFPLWVEKGLSGWQSRGSLIDIGTPENFQRAEGFFQNHSQISQQEPPS